MSLSLTAFLLLMGVPSRGLEAFGGGSKHVVVCLLVLLLTLLLLLLLLLLFVVWLSCLPSRTTSRGQKARSRCHEPVAHAQKARR